MDLQKMSKKVKNWFVENPEDDDGLDKAIPLDDVKLEQLKLIIEYCEHFEFKKLEHDLKAKGPLKTMKLDEFIEDEWELEFMKKLQQENCIDNWTALMYASSVMEVEALKELCCACIASFFKGKDTETLKKMFELGDEIDYTPENEK